MSAGGEPRDEPGAATAVDDAPAGPNAAAPTLFDEPLDDPSSPSAAGPPPSEDETDPDARPARARPDRRVVIDPTNL